MRRFERLPPPQYLTDNWERWSNRYAQNKLEKPNHTFQWVTHEGQKVNQKLLPLLIVLCLIEYGRFYPRKIGSNVYLATKPYLCSSNSKS